MLLRLFYDTKLAQASYLVGCQRTGEALVVDPNRDAGQYLAAARVEGLKIAHVTETHIHADYVSGSRELARKTGATLYLSDEGGSDWRYGFASDARAVPLKDTAKFKVGNVVVEALHTPGHTPEHMSFMITDGATTERPMGVFTGDFIFVGDVGRPDLLERAAGLTGTMEAGARQLYASLQRFKTLPDYLQLWPAHGAGSACGKVLGAVPSSTLGYERFANWGLTAATEEEFVRQVLAGQPEPPAYFARMKQVNRDGPPPLGNLERPPRQDAGHLAAALQGGAVVVDTRATREFAARHVPRSLNVPLSRSFLTYAGQVLPYDRPLYLIVGDEDRLREAQRELSLIGHDRLAGWFGAEVLEGAVGRVPQASAEEVAPRLATGDVAVIDVRARSEWEAGHLPGARHVPLSYLERSLAELPEGRPLVLHCETGSRSAVAASLLLANGFRDVANLTGGYAAWQRAGLPVQLEAPAPAGSAAAS